MASAAGTPIWYELICDDPDLAERYYGAVLGWVMSRAEAGGENDYRMAAVGDAPVAGVMRRPEGLDLAPRWLFYVAVDDVDETLERATDLGATVREGPRDIPGVGRFACLEDPQGALFYVMRPEDAGESRAFDPARDGHACWQELVTADQSAARRFYEALFGWRTGDAMPMGEAGDYTFLHHGEGMIGATMDRPDPAETPAWRFFFRVHDIDAALERGLAGGGRLLHEPTEIPGGDFAAQIHDPMGARVGLVGPRRREG